MTVPQVPERPDSAAHTADRDVADSAATTEVSNEPDSVAGRPPKRSAISAFVTALRPKQWSKNLLLFAGLLYTLDQDHSWNDLLRAAAGFAVFSFLSSAVYLINDVADRESDRLHPKKQFRPIAAGEISPATAVIAAVLIAAVCLSIAFALNRHFGTIALIYFAATIGYSFYFKHIVILDVLVLASGFVLRAIAGAVVIPVDISAWLILCTLMLALFLALSKRRAELFATIESGATVSRPILQEYSGDMLDQMIVIVTSCCVMSYALYTIESPAASRHHYLMFTIPFAIYAIFRYLYLAHRHALGESPDSVLLEDRPTLVNVLLFVGTTALIVTHTFARILAVLPH